MNDRPDAVAIARRFLDAMEERDLDAAQSLLSPDFAAVYPGDRRFRRLEDIVASGSGRYRDVRKTYLRTYFIPSGSGGIEVVVFSGTLSGAWADGEAFEGIRFTDQFRLAEALSSSSTSGTTSERRFSAAWEARRAETSQADGAGSCESAASASSVLITSAYL